MRHERDLALSYNRRAALQDLQVDRELAEERRRVAHYRRERERQEAKDEELNFNW